jgi:hypothetical protein
MRSHSFTEPGSDAGVDRLLDAVARVGTGVVDYVGRDHQRRPHAQASGFSCQLEGGDLDRALPDPAAGNACVADAREAFGEVALMRPSDGCGDLLDRPGKHETPDERLGAFLQ